jgi:hypothetical protein
MEIKASMHQLFPSEWDRLPVRQPDLLAQVVQHHRPAEGRRKCCNQEAMVTSGADPGYSSRGITSQAVGDEPLASDKRIRILKVT